MDRLNENYAYHRVPDDEWVMAGGRSDVYLGKPHDRTYLVNTLQVCLFGSIVVEEGWAG